MAAARLALAGGSFAADEDPFEGLNPRVCTSCASLSRGKGACTLEGCGGLPTQHAQCPQWPPTGCCERSVLSSSILC